MPTTLPNPIQYQASPIGSALQSSGILDTIINAAPTAEARRNEAIKGQYYQSEIDANKAKTDAAAAQPGLISNAVRQFYGLDAPKEGQTADQQREEAAATLAGLLGSANMDKIGPTLRGFTGVVPGITATQQAPYQIAAGASVGNTILAPIKLAQGEKVYTTPGDVRGPVLQGDPKQFASGASGTALPTQLQKLEDKDLDDIQTAEGLKTDLGAMVDQIKTGALKLGPYANIAATVKNTVGASDEQSRNYQTFQATLQRMRNDSLRLNKGTQTEGDAKRSWDELLTNPNDPQNVVQRLTEIATYNDRAATQKGRIIQNRRSSHGVGPLDLTDFMSQPQTVALPKTEDTSATSPPTPPPTGGVGASHVTTGASKYTSEDLASTAQNYGVTVQQAQQLLSMAPADAAKQLAIWRKGKTP